jgi:PPM family protein phosphatase
VRFTIFQDSHIGERKSNQDRLAYSYSKDVLLMVVADGMGGHARGEIAAEITIETITNRFQQEARGPLRRPLEFLESAFFSAHRAIVSYADSNRMLECPRTTCVACIFQNGKAYWAHSGDSRLYVFRDGKLAANTIDHSRVRQLIDAKVITETDALTHPDRNKIYNCLGGVLPPIVTPSAEWQLQVGDTFMLSSDGFWAPLAIPELAQRVRQQTVMDLIPDLMVQARKAAGEDADNLSVIAATWERQDQEAPGANVTSTEPMEGFSTTTAANNTTQQMRAVRDDISDEDIAKAISEIQDAIKRVGK